MSTSGIPSSTSSNLLGQQSINTSGGLTSTSTLTNSGAGGQLQITGLASGINTNQLIQAELAVKELPLTNMQDTITSLQNENTTLGAVQTVLQATALDALDLGEPSLFFQAQSVTSSSANLVTATPTGNLGAVIGSTTVEVAQLAGASQTTLAANLGTGNTTTQADDTLSVTVGSGTAQTIDIAAGSTLQQIANTINGSSTIGVYASVLNSQIVLSSRTTGTGNVISASDTAGYFSTTNSQDGQDAEIFVNGSTTPTYESSDTVTDAVPGVSLQLLGVTPTGSPVTLTTTPPAPNTANIIAAVQQFVKDYNSAISGIEGTINSAPPSEGDPSQASPFTDNLFGDPELENMLSSLRQTMYTSGAGLPTGMASLQDLGISTGDSNGTVNSSAVQGLLTVNTTTLTAAIQSNPEGVQDVLQAWASNYQTAVNAEASPFGAIETRIQGNTTQITDLQGQLQTQQEMFNNEEANMEQQWAQVEATLETLNNQKTSLTTFAASMAANNSASSS